jgi:excisionase family DNA binding protein
MRLSEPTLSVVEVAKLCRVNRRTVLRWVEEGGLRATRYGPRGRWRITDDALDAFIEVRNEGKKSSSDS